MLESKKTSQKKIAKTIESYKCNHQRPRELYEPIDYILSLGGKRLRPLLVLMGCDVFDGDINKALPCALSIEYFHNFTLMHDDIMDKAPLRRGKPTVHNEWNENIGILSGDAMLIKSYQYFEELPNKQFKKVLQLFNRTALQICEGQQYDINFETLQKVPIEEYIKMITYKTAVLLGCALQIGAIIAETKDTECTKIYNFGLQLGIAFQLQDDLLDVYANKAKFGKQIAGDILENKKTFLFLKALELADEKIKDQLLHWFSIKEFNPEEKINAVTQIYNQLHIPKHIQPEIDMYYQKAIDNLNDIEVKDERKIALKQLANIIMKREY